MDEDLKAYLDVSFSESRGKIVAVHNKFEDTETKLLTEFWK